MQIPFPSRRVLASVLGLAAVAALTAFVGLPERPLARTYTMFESFAYAGKCMDVYQGNLSNGNHIDVYSCRAR